MEVEKNETIHVMKDGILNPLIDEENLMFTNLGGRMMNLNIHTLDHLHM